MQPRRFLLGLFSEPMYDYNWSYTMAQIELIALDSPLVVYDRDKKENKGRVNATDANRKIAEWENKYKNKSKKVSISLEGLKMFQGNSIDDLNK